MPSDDAASVCLTLRVDPPATPTPDSIMAIGMGFFASKTLLSAVELDLFTMLAAAPVDADQIGDRLGLHPRARRDFLDALVALRLLDRVGDGPAATYCNAPDAAAFLDRNAPMYLGGILEMANERLYGFWGDLTAALRTGEPQNEIKQTGRLLWDVLRDDPDRLETFVHGMSGIQAGNFHAFAECFDFAGCTTVVDVGGAAGDLSIILASRHPHLRCTSLDLPAVAPIATAAVHAAGLDERVTIVAADAFTDGVPPADVVTMCNVLHDWDLERKQQLIAAAYGALPAGGSFVVIENIIDDARREHAFGLLMSLNMLIETEGGFDYTSADLAAWTAAAGFGTFHTVPLAGPASAGIATK